METNFSFSQLTEEKGTSPPDYRHYLRIWAKEKEAQKETIKDLPKMNQVDSLRIPAHVSREFCLCLGLDSFVVLVLWQFPVGGNFLPSLQNLLVLNGL